MVRKGFLILSIVVGLLLVAGTIAGSYVTYQNQQDKISSLKSQVSTLRADLRKAQAKQKSSAPVQSATTTYRSPKGVAITLYQPAKNAAVSSPVAVLGEVPGNWSSEASFPVVLKDSAGKVVAQATAQVLGEWMTDQLVPFSAKLTYSGTPTGTGTLILQKDNPSGLPTNDDSVSIPIRF